MVTLRLLGGFALEDDGIPLTGRAAQKRRLALLALIALAPGRTMSRDKLVAYLWPEGDTEQARHLLSVGLHDLRKVLGDTLVARGGDVALGNAFQSDVELFERAFEEGNPGHAISFYGGPFLDGFHLSDAPEFERWADVERKRLEGRFCTALERLADQRRRAGDARGAVEIWRRLVVVDPYNSRRAVGYMEALAEAGDRAGAIQHARVHEIMLREEFGISPGPEIVELAARLREEPSAGAPPLARRHDTDQARPQEGSIEESDVQERGGSGSPPQGGPSTAALTVGEPAADEPGLPGHGSAILAARSRPGQSSSPPQPARRRRRRRRFLLRAVVGACLILAVSALALYLRDSPGQRVASIAVLPLTDLSPANDNEFFSDGLSDEITNALASIDGLAVAARTSAFSFKGTNRHVREIGSTLGVDNLLEGSVRRDGDAVRIFVRLVDANTGFEVWSRTYDRAVDDVLAVQGEIARAVATALEVRLAGGGNAIARLSTDDPEAAELYWLGRYHWHRRTAEGFQRALEYFGRAITRDSTFAAAYTGVADVYALLGAYDYGVLPPDSALPIARSMLDRALQLDPGSAEAHAALGNLLFVYDWDVAGAEREFAKAIALRPDYAPAHHWSALALMAARRESEALRAIGRARALDPLSMVITSAAGRIEYFARRYDSAIREYRKAIQLDSTFVVAHLGLGLALVQTGDFDEAIAEYETGRRLAGDRPVILALQAHAHALAGGTDEAVYLLRQLEAVGGDRYVPAEYLAIIHIALGQPSQALSELERAYEYRSGAMMFLGLDPLFDPVRTDPRFEALTRRISIHPQ